MFADQTFIIVITQMHHFFNCSSSDNDDIFFLPPTTFKIFNQFVHTKQLSLLLGNLSLFFIIFLPCVIYTNTAYLLILKFHRHKKTTTCINNHSTVIPRIIQCFMPIINHCQPSRNIVQVPFYNYKRIFFPLVTLNSSNPKMYISHSQREIHAISTTTKNE